MTTRKQTEQASAKAKLMSYILPLDFIGFAAVTNRGLIQQFTVPTAQYARVQPDDAFPPYEPQPNIKVSFFMSLTRSQLENNNALHDTTGREAIMYVFQLTKTSEDDEREIINDVALRRLIGTYVAEQFTIHTNTIGNLGTTEAFYTYPKNFMYTADDPAYGTQERPLGDFLMPNDAIKIYLAQFEQTISYQQLSENDAALMEIFGKNDNETRDLAARGGRAENVVFFPGP
jgi:hypothetical protein